MAGKYLRFLTCIILIFCFPLVSSAGISVSPVKLFVSKKEPVATLMLTNTKDKPANFQIQAYKWTQNKLTPINNMIITPPIFTIKPSATQIVRFGFANLKETHGQQSYRIIAKQLPNINYNLKARHGFQLDVLLNISVPLFVGPYAPIEKKMQVLAFKKNGKGYITVKNTGNDFIHINQLKLKLADNKYVNIKSRKTYVLSQSSETWEIPTKNKLSGKSLELDLITDWKTYKETLVFGQSKKLSA